MEDTKSNLLFKREIAETKIKPTVLHPLFPKIKPTLLHPLRPIHIIFPCSSPVVLLSRMQIIFG